MKKSLVLLTLFLFAATLSFADEVTFSFIASGNGADVFGSAGGFSVGPATNVLVSDSVGPKSFPLSGTFNASAGAADIFTIGSKAVLGEFDAGGTNSVLITSPTLGTIVSGNMIDGSDFLATYPGGTGSFSGEFNVTKVNPAVLALFGLGPKFDPRGSVGITFGEDALVGKTLEGVIGGGVVTVVITTSTPEIMPFFLFGTGAIMTFLYLNRKNKLMV